MGELAGVEREEVGVGGGEGEVDLVGQYVFGGGGYGWGFQVDVPVGEVGAKDGVAGEDGLGGVGMGYGGGDVG